MRFATLLICKYAAILLVMVMAGSGLAQTGPASRYLSDLNWQEFAQWVPTRIQTVLVPVGTIEAHGAINNGADCTMPEALAKEMAGPLNALIAPLIPYGVTGTLTRYPGAIRVEPDVFGAYVEAVVRELARNKFKNIILINGHGGNRKALDEVAEKIGNGTDARVLVFDWWSHTSDITQEVFHEDGGHAGNNETAAVMAVNPGLVKKDLYRKDLAAPIDRSITAYPNPWSILLYKKGEGYPDFDEAKAREYYEKVVKKCTKLVQNVIAAWDRNGF